MSNRRCILRGLAAGAATLAVPPLLAQDTRAVINVVVGATNSMDIVSRLVAEQLRVALGRTAIVTPRLGAAQRLALGEVKRAAPDGNTLLVATSGPFTIFPNIYSGLEYDPIADFTPITGLMRFDAAMATGAHTGVKSMAQFVQWAGKQSSDIMYGVVPGLGSLSHFSAIAVGIETGVKMTPVPYKDTGLALTDLVGGRIPLMFTGLPTFIEMHRTGRGTILGVSGQQRWPAVADVPTFMESGVKVAQTTSVGVFGPAKMDPALVQRLHEAISPMTSQPQAIERLANVSARVWQATPKELAALLVSESQEFARLVKVSGFERQKI